MTTKPRIVLVFPILLLTMTAVGTADPNRVHPEETAEAARWIRTHLDETVPMESPGTGLYVGANNDPVRKSNRHGRPLNFSGEKIERGLYCHAFSRIVVHFDKPVDRLRARLGVDSNGDTSGGRGSVVFVVKTLESTETPSKAMLLGQEKETEIFRSEKIVEGMKPVPLDVALNGVRNFVLEVEDAGDGIACDQADWAELRMVIDDSELFLDELPFQWLAVGPSSTEPPFSFLYGGKPSAKLLPKWKREKTVRKIDERRTGHTVTWIDPETGLAVQCDAVQYHDFPTVEWVVRFRNTGKTDTPILSDIRSVDIPMESTATVVEHPWQGRNIGSFHSSGRGDYVLHHSKGSRFARDEFLPFEDTLRTGDSKTVATEGGRPSRGALPYFNVERKTGGGRIVAVGWPGQWSATFENGKESGFRITGGQEQTHFTLHPGEEVRTPMTVVQFWHGNDRIRSQNIWRRWMLAFGTPQKDGKPVPPHFAACSSHQYNEMINATDGTQIEMIDRYLAEGIKLDYWWMDAGWYVMKNTNRWPETGTWEVDRKRFPDGLRKVSDHAHSKGVGVIVWFEPERVHAGTWLTENHPDWILGGKDGGLLDLGNPAAWSWLVDHVDKILTEEKIDFYRQDFNTDPLPRWRANDAPDRQGITEIRHVTGYLAYWDELLRRHPGLRIDTCASGGNRLDLETLRRSVPLLRSDWIFDPSANQNHTQSLSFWIPLFGTGETLSAHSDLFPGRTGGVEPYRSRSALVPFINSCTDMRRPADPAKQRSGSADYPNMRRYFADWQRCAEYFYGDYYPLTPYSLDESTWMAWQFDLPADLPEGGKGMVQIFRRENSFYEAARFPLHGLDSGAKYVVEDIDRGLIGTFSGKELLERGIRFEANRKPGSGILFYRKVPCP